MLHVKNNHLTWCLVRQKDRPVSKKSTKEDNEDLGPKGPGDLPWVWSRGVTLAQAEVGRSTLAEQTCLTKAARPRPSHLLVRADPAWPWQSTPSRSCLAMTEHSLDRVAEEDLSHTMEETSSRWRRHPLPSRQRTSPLWLKRRLCSLSTTVLSDQRRAPNRQIPLIKPQDEAAE